MPLIERFALLLSITVIWAYAHLLTASEAYKHRPERTQDSCRTDRAHLISSAPWSVTNLNEKSSIFCFLSFALEQDKDTLPATMGSADI